MTAALPELVSANELKKFIRAVLEAVGVPPENASLAAEVVVAGEQYGLKVIDLDGLNLDMLAP